jgi:hypothetical protein
VKDVDDSVTDDEPDDTRSEELENGDEILQQIDPNADDTVLFGDIITIASDSHGS